MPTSNKPRRLGRPPDSSSDRTRERLLRAARECFAQHGYSKTTNNDIASAAGITTGAIYHYFDSKQALFAAVTSEVSQMVIEEFRSAVDGVSAFRDKIAALLDAAAQIHEDDPSIASFTVTYPIEVQRHPELLEAVDPAANQVTAGFFRAITQEAADQGEIPAGMSVDDVANMILSVTLGLAYFGVLSGSTEALRSTMKATNAVISLAFGDAPHRLP